ncbi:hypothetical protein Dimus_022844, partial [Dionaea muscipula]
MVEDGVRVIEVAITQSTLTSHCASSGDMDDYRIMHDHKSMPTADSSHMASQEHPPLPPP